MGNTTPATPQETAQPAHQEPLSEIFSTRGCLDCCYVWLKLQVVATYHSYLNCGLNILSSYCQYALATFPQLVASGIPITKVSQQILLENMYRSK